MAPLVTPGPMPSTSHRTSASTSRVRSPSPNYFGFQAPSSTLPISTYNHDPHSRTNWSPPSSTVRSTAAFTPSIVPLDQNPDYAAFRRQSEGIGRTFSLGNLHTFTHGGATPTSAAAKTKEKHARSTHQTPAKPSLHTLARSPPPRPGPYVLDPDGLSLGRSPKRHLSSDSTNFPEHARKSPPATHSSESIRSLRSGGDITTSPAELEQPPLFALQPAALLRGTQRADTVPAANSHDSGSLVSPQHVVNLISTDSEDVLLLDLRVSTQYGRSRIVGALNLCIPTTLMKRPSFNVDKLAETFKSVEDKTRFAKWKNSKYIVVYDSAATQIKDAAICINTIKKFESEGYQGITYIIRGGFADFAKAFPSYIDNKSTSVLNGRPKLTMPGQGEPLPVIGGCPMPAAQSAANPFFGNIRQNMDLIGGVGQMSVKRPTRMYGDVEYNLPAWLRSASDEKDDGKQISEKFLHIEKREQKRMQQALSGEVSYGTSSLTSPTSTSVQIAGIEKGSKNRYNNIWPFEHTRVKIEDVPDDGCDYVNANHIKSSLSNKRYIATQGPIPATFSDFWNVVWQQDVRVIVMLTAEKEGGQIKAHDYWSGSSHGPFRLEQLSESRATLDLEKMHRRHGKHGSRKTSVETSKPIIIRNDSKGEKDVHDNLAKDEPFVTVRHLTLSHEQYPFQPIREITHLQYSSWPDFGAPAHPAHLLGLVEQCDSVVRSATRNAYSDPEPPESRPILVHCSAGCGRTGTFCTVDTVIDMLKRQRLSTRNRREATPMDLDTRRPNGFKTPKKRKSASDVAESNEAFSSPPSMTRSDSADSASENLAIDGDWIGRDDLDLIEKTVEDFRHQRLSMVQSLRQFVLCYESVLEWLVEEDR